MSSRGFPSLTALLGLLAIAGYQNRDKIAEMLKGLQGNSSAANNPLGGGAASSGSQGGLRDVLGPLQAPVVWEEGSHYQVGEKLL